MSETTSTPQLPQVIIQLFKGVLYQDKQPDLWNNLLNLQAGIRDYVGVIGLQLFIDEAEGYAFLRQRQEEMEAGNETENVLPRLIQRRPLGYFVSLLCVLLRKKLLEQDAASGDTRPILTHEQLLAMLTVFMPERSNEVKTIEQISSCINKVIELGFLRPLEGAEKSYEIRRIVKALVDANWLSDIEKKLQEYQTYADSSI
jgi:hypothetical protein